MRSIACLLVVAFVSLALAASCGGSGSEEAPTSTTTPSFGRAVRYDTDDGVHVVAEVNVPEDVAEPPIVILLHQYEGSRRQWDGLAPKLLEAGYAVIAPDLRSFGDSTQCLRDAKEESCRLDDFDDLVKDLDAVIGWAASRQQGFDTDRIAVIGASMGGNLAYVASGGFEAVDTVVSMSPSADPGGDALLGKGIEGFSPHSVLFMSDDAEAADARALAANAAAPVEVKVYEGATAHGVELLDNPQAVQDVLDWLEQTL